MAFVQKLHNLPTFISLLRSLETTEAGVRMRLGMNRGLSRRGSLRWGVGDGVLKPMPLDMGSVKSCCAVLHEYVGIRTPHLFETQALVEPKGASVLQAEIERNSLALLAR